MREIEITNAGEGNLKNISLKIPKNQLVVFTGVSGSGKSTLLVDVLFNECQRQFLEAMSFQGIHKPNVERIRGVSPAILISQEDANRNPRSTVGTMTDVYTDLRMIFEKLGVRCCPHCGATISSADCREETEKIGEDFHVYMYCSVCGKRMDKFTRTDFSFNTKEGACPACEGLGQVHAVREEAVLDEKRSLEAGAVLCWEKKYGEYQTGIFFAALQHYGIPIAAQTAVENYTELQKDILLHGLNEEKMKSLFPQIAPPKTVLQGKYEGIYPILWRRLAEKEGEGSRLAPYFETAECPQCHGERLCAQSRAVTVNGKRLPELSKYALEELLRWVKELEDSLPETQYELVRAYLIDIQTKLRRFVSVGVGYLSLDRQVITLSGGELQRLRLAGVLDSDLTNVIYILDEPTKGLHPQDTAGMIEILQKLRDLENTVLVIEHDPDVMAAADFIVDIGPGAGRHGGEIVAAGTMAELKDNPKSATGRFWRRKTEPKTDFRKGNGRMIRIENAEKFNLKNITVTIPAGCFTTVTGPSGSGKSTLIFEILAREARREQPMRTAAERSGGLRAKNTVSGLELFSRAVVVGQSGITKMKRSNVATYSEVYTEIRSIFAKMPEAHKAGLTAKHFSFNTPGGRCEMCGGLGKVNSNMLFFADIEVTCPSCGGSRFHENVLAVKYQGCSIKDVLEMSVEEAAELFKRHKKATEIFALLQEVGLGYLQLGQTLTTLSGGECQRLQLAKELLHAQPGKETLYLLDEPTVGLHPEDVAHFLRLVSRLADAGNTVVVVEHNQQVIADSDWVIDLGPEGGQKGGELVFAGTPHDLKQDTHSVTGRYLRV